MSESAFITIMKLITGVALGAILGSFLTMLSYRVPRGQSIVVPRSFCPNCQKTIGWRDLIPLYSYVELKGRCRHCRTPFGRKYLLIEIASVIVVTLLVFLLS
ncbi:MAG TPA: prepilin peptidase [Alphaproteobacteria bacterium]|nr:prepilin peptidase [Alphaproteobacteria bacterium]